GAPGSAQSSGPGSERGSDVVVLGPWSSHLAVHLQSVSSSVARVRGASAAGEPVRRRWRTTGSRQLDARSTRQMVSCLATREPHEYLGVDDVHAQSTTSGSGARPGPGSHFSDRV